MNVVFVTNRGGTHPNRLLYFNSVKADYQFVDFRIKWHGTSNSKFRMILSGVVCALTFPNRRKYDLFVTSDPQLPAVLMRMLGLLRKDQKIATYLGSQTLYFTYSKYFSRFTIFYYRFLLKRYDAHICNGPVQAELLRSIIKVPEDRIFVNFNGISPKKYDAFVKNKYDPASKTILFIGNLYSQWRLHYKGTDLLLHAYAKVKEIDPALRLHIVGDYDSSLDALLDRLPEHVRSSINITGKLEDISTAFSDILLYVHPSRGDALPNSLTESLCAGVPAVVSEWTGGADLVKQIDENLVCTLDADALVTSLSYFMALSDERKREYSERARSLVREFTDTRAVERFKFIIAEISRL